MDLIEGLLSLDSNIDATRISEILWLAEIMQGNDTTNKKAVKSTNKIIKSEIKSSRIRNNLQNDHSPQENIHEVVISRVSHKHENSEMTFENAGKIPTFVAGIDDKNVFSSIVKYLEEFKIKQKTQSKILLDEKKTAEYMANTEIMNPSFRQEKQKKSYFTLNLIIDKHESMFVWREMIDVFKNDIKLSNAFKQTNLLSLDSSSNEAKIAYALSNRTLSASSPIFSDRASITIFVSDIIGNAWKSNSVFNDLIQHWINKTFVCIVSLLPRKYWQRTPLSQGSNNLVYSNKKLPKNSDLKVQHDFIEKELSKNLNRIPVMTMDGTSLLYLSHLLHAKKNKLLNAYIFEKLETKAVAQKPIYNPTLNEIEQKVEKFFSMVSTETKYLAIYCSVLPLHPQIIKDVIKVKKLGNILETFAEFTFGGLLDRTSKNNKYKYYDFYPNVRRVLMRYINMSEIESIYRILDNNIKQVLGISKAFIELLYEANIDDEPVGKIEKELIEILINVLQEKGSIVEQEKISRLTNKINTVYPENNWFFMGSKDGDSDEKPVHEVIFNYDFEIAKYPVTFEEYDLFCEDTGKEKPDDNGWGRGKRPVINVSWHDAKEYCKWLSEKTGENYRLPTEAEWEYACRAGTTTKWSFGDDEKELENYAWYDKNNYDLGVNHPDYGTHPVGEKLPNPWGLYDMHGNVWEWCEDDYVDSYDKTPRDGKAHIDNKADSKVFRGGSWDYNANFTRSTSRDGGIPSARYDNRGFRLLRTLPSDLGDIVNNTTVKKSKKNVPKADVTFKCEKCSTPYALNCDELDWQQVNGSERNMGAELEHQAEYFKDCDNCGNEMLITLSCWEYPIGVENYRDVNGEGVKDIKGDCCLDFHSGYKEEFLEEDIYSNLKRDTELKQIEEEKLHKFSLKVSVKNKKVFEIEEWLLKRYKDPNSFPVAFGDFALYAIEDIILEHFGDEKKDIINEAVAYIKEKYGDIKWEMKEQVLFDKVNKRINKLEQLIDLLIPYSDLEYTSDYDREDYFDEDEYPEPIYLISREFDGNYLGDIIEDMQEDVYELHHVAEEKDFEDKQYIENLLEKEYRKEYESISEFLGIDWNCNVYSEHDMEYPNCIIYINPKNIINNIHEDVLEVANTEVDMIKEWFFQHYGNPAEHLPYESKEGGYQWIHGGPVDAEEVIYEYFEGEYSEEVLKEAIDEIGRYKQWSPIPQSEEDFQDALGNWAKKGR
jgi:formylglycine-generating enzyme required for sulfatase activity/Zn finger protein HypA/HybF involved in hydrogenase expression